jgi:hypothetical protein
VTVKTPPDQEPDVPKGPPLPLKPPWVPVNPGAVIVYVPVEPTDEQDDHREHSDDDMDEYDEDAVGVAEHAEWRQLDTEAACVAPHHSVGAGHVSAEE